MLGQHFIYDDNKQLRIFGTHNFTDEELIRYAEYIETAVKLNIPDIIVHPDIYMHKRENFGEIESKVANMICKVVEKYNIPLEINLAKVFNKTYYENKKLNNDSIEKQKEKLSKVDYPRKEFWEIVTQYDIKVLYGIDVHHRGQITLYKELIELANEIIGQETIKKLKFIKE